jgi:hypothetical protein
LEHNQTIMTQLRWMNLEPYHYSEKGKNVENQELKDGESNANKQEVENQSNR